MKNKIVFGILCAIVCEIIFGFSFLFTKKITNTVSTLNLLSWRFIIAFLFLNICALLRIIKLNFKGKQLKSLFLVALFQPVIYFIGETVGINLTTASESGVIISSIPIVTLLFSALILKESPTRLQILGVSTTAVGILIMVLVKGIEASFNPIGYIMLFLAVISYSLYSVYSEKATEFSSIEKTYAMMAFGAITFTFMALIQNINSGTLKEYLLLPVENPDFLNAIGYLSIVSSVVAFLLYNLAIEYLGTNRTASFVGVSTIVTVVAGVIFLKEDFSSYQIIGTILVIVGVYLANIIKDDDLKSQNYEVKKVS
ncbi:MAG: EamA/RhaT family transporter [Bacillales bacterium]|jgi:drug/metabolite transporter (DMT)-like permease|nr:EamA/RhaT family transporter [Bacillales bacterium]